MRKITWTLFAVFLTLKLSGAVGWQWIWVAAPLWVPCVWAFAAALFCAMYGFKMEKLK